MHSQKLAKSRNKFNIIAILILLLNKDDKIQAKYKKNMEEISK